MENVGQRPSRGHNQGDFSVLSALILPLTIVKVPGPFQQIHPQIIRFTLALRPGLMHCGIHSHTYFLFSPMITLHSSERNTRFQSPSSFQCIISLSPCYSLFYVNFRIRMFVRITRVWYLYETNIFHSNFRNRTFSTIVRSVLWVFSWHDVFTFLLASK